jgi:hypothetical protein
MTNNRPMKPQNNEPNSCLFLTKSVSFVNYMISNMCKTKPKCRRSVSVSFSFSPAQRDVLVSFYETNPNGRSNYEKTKRTHFFSVALCASLWQEMQNKPNSPHFQPKNKDRSKNKAKSNPFHSGIPEFFIITQSVPSVKSGVSPFTFVGKSGINSLF